MRNISKMLPDWFIALIAGIFNGIMDSIAWHNSYENYGWFWDLNSWKNLYANASGLERLLNTSLNGWHLFKWAMFTCFFLLIFRNALLPHKFEKKEWILYFLLLIIFFIIGFQLSYK